MDIAEGIRRPARGFGTRCNHIAFGKSQEDCDRLGAWLAGYRIAPNEALRRCLVSLQTYKSTAKYGWDEALAHCGARVPDGHSFNNEGWPYCWH